MVDPDAPAPADEPAADGDPDIVEVSSLAIAAGTMVGDFVVEARIGSGGMATVYSAVQPVIGKRAAIKIMNPALCVDPTAVARFVQEARAVNQIGHPNIVDAFAFGALADGRSYMVMEWLQGETLAERLQKGPLGIGEAIAVIFQICDGLAAAHDKGIVHRDLKPENVFLVPVRNRRLLVKLLDFGIAKLRGPQHDPNVSHTQPGKTIGTPRYMAPEQARGKAVDYRADVYALGVTAYEMFTGNPPFMANEAIDVMHQHVHAQPEAPSTKRADLPLEIERLVLQMLEKKPDKRPTLMQIEARLADVRDRLALPSVDGVLAPAPNDEGREPSNKHIVRPPAQSATEESDAAAPSRRNLFIGAAVAAAALGLVVGLALTRGKPAPPKPQPVIVAASTTIVPPAPKPATLALTVNVPNARVELDGAVLAESTPGGLFTVDAAGTHTLAVSAPHRKSWQKTLAFTAGSETPVDVELERAQAAAPVKAPIVKPAAGEPAAKKPRHRDDMIDPFAGQ
jgi:eukaryotic-like serine/threonine-protein kinase